MFSMWLFATIVIVRTISTIKIKPGSSKTIVNGSFPVSSYSVLLLESSWINIYLFKLCFKVSILLLQFRLTVQVLTSLNTHNTYLLSPMRKGLRAAKSSLIPVSSPSTVVNLNMFSNITISDINIPSTQSALSDFKSNFRNLKCSSL
jgi:hypothetical protein